MGTAEEAGMAVDTWRSVVNRMSLADVMNATEDSYTGDSTVANGTRSMAADPDW